MKLAEHNQWQFPAFLVALSIGMVTLLYGWLLWYGEFFSDDFTWLWHGQRLWPVPWEIFTRQIGSFYSPVLNAFYTVFYKVFGYWAAPYLFAGLVVHVLVAYSIGLFTYRLTNNHGAAILVTLLASVVGPAYEPLVWIASNLHSVATLFIVLALLSYERFLKQGRTTSLVLTLVWYALALATKEVAIVTPILLALLWWLHRSERIAKRRGLHPAFIIAAAALTTVYAIVEYYWQRAGFTVESGLWRVDFTQFVRLPLLLADLVVPLTPLLNASNASAIWLIATVAFISFIIASWHLPVARFGLAWAVVTILPTIFFGTATWWGLLASRYTYLPRLGLILAIGAWYAHFAEHKNLRRWFVGWLVLLMVYQSMVMSITVWGDYAAYVYKTGSSLQLAARTAAAVQIERMYVATDRPFEANEAYIVGALETLGNIRESNIVFLKTPEAPSLKKNEAVLRWSPQLRSYQVIFGE